MTNTKKTLMGITIPLVLLIIAVGIGFAFMAGHHGTGYGERGRFYKGMPPFLKKEIREFILWRMDKGARNLDLQENQQTAYDEFRAGIEQMIQSGMDNRHALKQQVSVEFEKNDPDLSIVAQDVQSVILQMSSKMTENLKLFTAFYKTLHPDQQKQISQAIKEKMKHHDRYHQIDEQQG